MDLEKIGNTELLKCFLSLHYQLYGFYENELREDPRSCEYLEMLQSLMCSCNDDFKTEKLYCSLLDEAQRRGLNRDFIERGFDGKSIIFSEQFIEWQKNMLSFPTYIREINATNFLGDYDISFIDDDFIGFDYPVRSACKILNKNGYITYWSSANRQDYLLRRGQIIEGKSVAYILIKPNCLTTELKRLLLLDGSCDFWVVALQYQDDGKYYGIWSEILSWDSLCEDISMDLSNQAMSLPNLETVKSINKL